MTTVYHVFAKMPGRDCWRWMDATIYPHLATKYTEKYTREGDYEDVGIFLRTQQQDKVVFGEFTTEKLHELTSRCTFSEKDLADSVANLDRITQLLKKEQ